MTTLTTSTAVAYVEKKLQGVDVIRADKFATHVKVAVREDDDTVSVVEVWQLTNGDLHLGGKIPSKK